MWRRTSALLFASFVVAACQHGPRMEQVSLVPSCEESHPEDCEDGKPLCMVDEGSACLMCRCVPMPPLTPEDVRRMVAGPWGPAL